MAKINRLLSDLMCTQNSVIHMINSRGREGADEVRQLLDERNAIRDEIVEYVELLERLAGSNCSSATEKDGE